MTEEQGKTLRDSYTCKLTGGVYAALIDLCDWIRETDDGDLFAVCTDVDIVTEFIQSVSDNA